MFKDIGILFANNYNSTAEVVVNQGGTSSGKTYNILKVLFAKLAEQPGKHCTVVGQTIPNLKSGAMKDSEDIISKSPILRKMLKSFNKTDRKYTYWNKSAIEFKSYSDVQDSKSGKRDYLFVNEANGIPFSIYTELSQRTTIQEFIDYNPNAEFWVHEKLIGQPNVQLIISDHRHNPFVSDKIRKKIEGYRDVDLELWRVYARGLTGKIEGLILRNWEIIEDIPKEAKYIGTGLDFGFTNDPSAAVDVWQINDTLIVDELFYESTDNLRKIKTLFDENGYKRRDSIVADSSAPLVINEMNRMGLRTEASIKGPDSIKLSIELAKAQKLLVTRRSENLRKELLSWMWKKDKHTGASLNEPIDAFNHAIDAFRYVLLNKLNRKHKVRATA